MIITDCIVVFLTLLIISHYLTSIHVCNYQTFFIGKYVLQGLFVESLCMEIRSIPCVLSLASHMTVDVTCHMVQSQVQVIIVSIIIFVLQSDKQFAITWTGFKFVKNKFIHTIFITTIHPCLIKFFVLRQSGIIL